MGGLLTLCRRSLYNGESLREQESTMKGVQYLVDDRGARRAVVIDLRKQGELWEDFYDRAVAESRCDEPRESLETVKTKLARGRGRRTRG